MSEFDDTPAISNGKHVVRTQARRYADIAILLVSLSEHYQEASQTFDALTADEQTILKTILHSNLTRTIESLETLNSEKVLS